MIDQYADFALKTLVPAARAILLQRFEEYKKGVNIGITGKKDGTPASEADRESEAAMRQLIAKTYPDHGVVGEEFGADRADAEYVWVLDPLDGTKEFLDRQVGWCILIALMKNGKPVLGIIDDPLEKRSYCSVYTQKLSAPPVKIISASNIACTYPDTMFEDSAWKKTAPALLAQAKTRSFRLNGLGFAYTAQGLLDMTLEAGLKLHDIAALLPILWAAGAQTLDSAGSDYRDHTFDLSAGNRNYELLTSCNPDLMAQARRILGAT